MKTLFMMCGLPGSGKSTFAAALESVPCVCLDNLREEFYGNASIQGDGAFIFNAGIERVKSVLRNYDACIYDATNVDKRARQNVMSKLPIIDRFICVWLDTPLDECLKRNEERKRHVPQEVIKRMAAKFEIPTKEEGFISIWHLV